MIKLTDLLNENFNKQDLEVIAYCLALIEMDAPNPKVRKQIQRILGDLQKKGIWGNIEE